MCDSVSADHMDQKFFEIQRQKLLRTKGTVLFLIIFSRYGLSRGEAKSVSCFRNNASQNTSFGIGNSSILFSKNFIHGELHAKEITMIFGAVLPFAFKV